MHREKTAKRKTADGGYGADDGNRTRVIGLGSGCSAIELHLRITEFKYKKDIKMELMEGLEPSTY